MQHVRKSGQMLSASQVQQLVHIGDVIVQLKDRWILLFVLGVLIAMGIIGVMIVSDVKMNTYLLSLLGIGFCFGYMQQMGRALCYEESEQSSLMMTIDKTPGKTISIQEARERVRHQEMTFAEAMLIVSSLCLIGAIAMGDASSLSIALCLWGLGIFIVFMLGFYVLFFCHRASFRLWMMMRRKRGATCPQ